MLHINEKLNNVIYKEGIEIPLNEYLDNKRVYARLYEGNIPSGSSSGVNVIDVSSLSFDKIWLDVGNSWYRVSSNGATLSLNWYYSSNDWARTLYQNNKVVLRTGSSSTLNTYHIIIKYTKTTD